MISDSKDPSKNQSQDQNKNNTNILAPAPIPLAEVHIDQKWIKAEIENTKHLFECPVCFNFIVQPVECEKCQRLFCKQDYKSTKPLKNICPLCKATPWNIKKSIHISYKILYENLIFGCQECKDDTKYKLEELKLHLKDKHNQIIKQSQKNKLYKYVVNDNGTKIQLNFTQNLQINYKILELKKDDFKILDEKFGFIYIFLNEKKCLYQDANKKVIECALQSQQAKPGDELSYEKQFIVWAYDNHHQHEPQQFYVQSVQKVIQKGYKQYEAEPFKLQMSLDIPNVPVRYRIIFNTMVQLNTSTNFKRKIFRKIIKLKQQ